MAKQEKKLDKSTSFEDVAFKKVEILEDGKYTGTIVSVDRDLSTFDYTRYKVKVDDKELTLAVSFPTDITFTVEGKPSSAHAVFLSKFGYNLESGETFSKIVEDIVGKDVSFLVQQKKTDKGTFAEIVKDSVKVLV